MDNKKLAFTIQKLIEKEVKKNLDSILIKITKEQIRPFIQKTIKATVKNTVNEVLNEKLINLLLEIKQQPQNLNKVFQNENNQISLKEQEEAGIRKFMQQQKQNSSSLKDLREQMKKKLGIEDSPIANLIYDVDEGPINSPHPIYISNTLNEEQIANIDLKAQGYQGEDGIYYDSDDEGVDISKFNF